jgi:hypothetical protein
MNEQTRDFGNEVDRVREAMNMQMEMLALQLRKLGELRDEGLLTEEEFSAKKAELLNRLG